MLDVYIVLKLLSLGDALTTYGVIGLILFGGVLSVAKWIGWMSEGPSDKKDADLTVKNIMPLFKIGIIMLIVGGLIPTRDQLALMIGVDVFRTNETVQKTVEQVGRIGQKGLDRLEKELDTKSPAQ